MKTTCARVVVVKAAKRKRVEAIVRELKQSLES